MSRKASCCRMHKRWHHEVIDHDGSLIYRKLWITGLRIVLRSLKNDCVQCKKLSHTMNFQLSDLLQSRIKLMGHPFCSCATYYYGAFQVKRFQTIVNDWPLYSIARGLDQLSSRSSWRWTSKKACLNITKLQIYQASRIKFWQQYLLSWGWLVRLVKIEDFEHLNRKRLT